MLNQLLSQLTQRASTALVCNQYQDPDRLKNVGIYFDYLLTNKPGLMLVGEAPGYLGCRLTGIPFTSEDVIQTSEHPFFKKNHGLFKLHGTTSERTATMLWSILGPNRPLPLLWNAFPFHPHRANEPKSNRKPTSEEMQEGEHFIRCLYSMFGASKVYAIGRVSQQCLSKVFPQTAIGYIRHPSYGGKREFLNGMRGAFQSALAGG